MGLMLTKYGNMSEQKSGENLLTDLREGTLAQHCRVEKHLLLRQLMASTLSLEEYSRIIAAFTGFYATLEPRMQAISARFDFPGYEYQPRLPLLIKDRETLPVCAVTPCTMAPEYASADELLGVLYVLEGATQGGRVIAPWLQQKLALTDAAGARYFNFYRQRSWQTFRTMVGNIQQHYDYCLVVTAARATFDHLHSHLDHCLCSTGD